MDFVSTPALHYCAPSFSTFLVSLLYSRGEMGGREKEGGRFEVILCGAKTGN